MHLHMYTYIYWDAWRKTWAIERDPRTARNSALPSQTVNLTPYGYDYGHS